MLTPISQPLRISAGINRPALFETCGATDVLNDALETAETLYRKLNDVSPAVAQYAVTHAHRQRILVALNLRELVELLRLRTSARAHESIRRPCQALEEAIRQQQPELMDAVLGPAGNGAWTRRQEA